jgi:hypothetical protein
MRGQPLERMSVLAYRRVCHSIRAPIETSPTATAGPFSGVFAWE